MQAENGGNGPKGPGGPIGGGGGGEGASGRLGSLLDLYFDVLKEHRDFWYGCSERASGGGYDADSWSEDAAKMWALWWKSAEKLWFPWLGTASVSECPTLAFVVDHEAGGTMTRSIPLPPGFKQPIDWGLVSVEDGRDYSHKVSAVQVKDRLDVCLVALWRDRESDGMDLPEGHYVGQVWADYKANKVPLAHLYVTVVGRPRNT